MWFGVRQKQPKFKIDFFLLFFSSVTKPAPSLINACSGFCIGLRAWGLLVLFKSELALSYLFGFVERQKQLKYWLITSCYSRFAVTEPQLLFRFACTCLIVSAPILLAVIPYDFEQQELVCMCRVRRIALLHKKHRFALNAVLLFLFISLCTFSEWQKQQST